MPRRGRQSSKRKRHFQRPYGRSLSFINTGFISMIIKQKEKKKERKTATNFQVVPKLFPYSTFLMSAFVLLFGIQGFIGTPSVYYLLLNLRLLAVSYSVFI